MFSMKSIKKEAPEKISLLEHTSEDRRTITLHGKQLHKMHLLRFNRFLINFKISVHIIVLLHDSHFLHMRLEVCLK